MKRFKFLSCICALLGLVVFLTGCSSSLHNTKPKEMTYFRFFDTVSYIYGYADDSQKEFEKNCEGVSKLLEEYHRLFDIYNDYPKVNNLHTVNLNAGKEPVKVDKKLIDFLLYAKEMYNTTDGEMNVMMGSVLSIWHDRREQANGDPSTASLPTKEELEEANLHTDISLLEIDEKNQMVRITDPKAQIDVGALGKGYATEKAAEYLYDIGAISYVLNIGGNIRIIGQKPDGKGWITGIKNPSAPDRYSFRLIIADTSCVTTGDYERYFSLDGKRYHHVIDKDTLMPSTYFSSVTVITKNSGLADALSTALFTMSYEDGLKLIEKTENVDVIWITPDGTQYYTDGISKMIIK